MSGVENGKDSSVLINQGDNEEEPADSLTFYSLSNNRARRSSDNDSNPVMTKVCMMMDGNGVSNRNHNHESL